MKLLDEKLKILVSFVIKPEQLRQIRRISKKITVDFTKSPDEVVRRIREVDILFAGRFNNEILFAAKQLKWIHATSAGIERFLFPEFVKSPILLTCSRTVYDIPVAEHSLALILGLTRQIHTSVQKQINKEWTRPEGMELNGKTDGDESHRLDTHTRR